jgi:ACT domain-containing protein
MPNDQPQQQNNGDLAQLLQLVQQLESRLGELSQKIDTVAKAQAEILSIVQAIENDGAPATAG